MKLFTGASRTEFQPVDGVRVQPTVIHVNDHDAVRIKSDFSGRYLATWLRHWLLLLVNGNHPCFWTEGSDEIPLADGVNAENAIT
jgi:hypothetical protein